MKKKRLFREEIKDRHTNHWDMDMMTRAELEAAMSQKPQSSAAEETDSSSTDQGEGEAK